MSEELFWQYDFIDPTGAVALRSQTPGVWPGKKLPWTNNTVYGRLIRRQGQLEAQFNWQAADAMDPATTEFYLQCLIAIIDDLNNIEIGVVDVLDIFKEFVIVKAYPRVYDWIWNNWPVWTGNYRDKVANSVMMGKTTTGIIVTWSRQNVLNSSGEDYSQYVEKHTPIWAGSLFALKAILDITVMEVATLI